MSLYDDFFYSPSINQIFSEKSIIEKMLQFEAVLARSQAISKSIPAQAAEVISNCCVIDRISVDRIKKEVTLSGNAAFPLIKQLTELVRGADTDAEKYVHLGTTSQDVIDTSHVLMIREYAEFVKVKLDQLIDLLIAKTRKYKETVMIGRTMLQHAKPITFGIKTAGWLESVWRVNEKMQGLKNQLTIQLGGTVGSEGEFLSNETRETFAELLQLKSGPPWHTRREVMAEWACISGILSGCLGKIAKDIILMMQTDVGEVSEGYFKEKGSSSAMPHKQNPVICSAILANANRVPHLVASILSSMPQEHERSPGLWHSEWEVLVELLSLTAGSVERTVGLIKDLKVDAEAMKRNIEKTNGLVYSENIAQALSLQIGRKQAHELVRKACKISIEEKKNLKEVIQKLIENIPQIDKLFDPEKSVGSSLRIIDSILKKVEEGNGD